MLQGGGVWGGAGMWGQSESRVLGEGVLGAWWAMGYRGVGTWRRLGHRVEGLGAGGN